MKMSFVVAICGILSILGADVNYNEAQNRFKSGDYELSIKLLEKSCENHFAKSCATLGSIYYVGYMLEKDLKKSANYFTKACKEGEKNSCNLKSDVLFLSQNILK